MADKKLTDLQAKAEEYLQLETHPHFKQDLQQVLDSNNLEELNDRFYTELEFGTGGLRGVMGGGYNRINPYIIRKATQGLANYIEYFVQETGEKGSAVIAYDSRKYSDLFAQEAALVLCAHNFRVYLFSDLRPAPELSFAVRHYNATAGIVVTASHNPPEYNGYKVYWKGGGQIVPPHDKGIIEKVRAVKGSIPIMDKDEALSKGLLKIIDDEVDGPFTEMVKSCSLRPELLQERGKELTVVYTPLHGTGTMLIERTLGEMGVEVITVPEQRTPDGNFPTVDSPNPEEPSALEMGIALAKKKGADLLMGTDPDGDRLGIAVPEVMRNSASSTNKSGAEAGAAAENDQTKQTDYVLITGNQLGVLLADYIFSTMQEQAKMPAKPAFVKTIVTTELQRLLAEKYNVAVYDVLTGFKYIAHKITEFEKSGETYLFGGEESYGYLVTTQVRDKDAVSAAFLTAEMTLYHRAQGKGLLDRLHEIYRELGYFQEAMVTGTFKGEQGKAAMDDLISTLRENPPSTLGGLTVKLVKDYKTHLVHDIEQGTQEKKIDLPASNVLQFVLENSAIVTVRPSGTEPKIKFYISGNSGPGLDLDIAKEKVNKQVQMIRQDIEKMVD